MSTTPSATCSRKAHPDFDDETLFQRARLINAALLAKIHTVEWTPAVTAHPTAVAGLHANWWGLEGEKLHNIFGRLTGSEALSGIPGRRPRTTACRSRSPRSSSPSTACIR